MAGVTSVEFRLQRDGAPIFIDEFERIALDSLRGQFSVPGKAQAELEVTVNDNLATRLGAVAVDDEVWISNPVTGDFETLPAGYDIDPSKFFDPENGWQPLLANLQNVTMVGVDDRGGERYHITGTAPAAQVSDITVGLVQGQDVTVDFWIHPGTYLVTAAEFETTIDGGTSDWTLELDHYGDTFTIEPPANVARDARSVRGQQRWLISPPLPPTPRRRPSPAAILAVVGFSVFVAADDLTVVATMLRPIIGDLGLVLPDGLNDAAWIVNAYLIAFVAVMPIAGRISDVLGRRRTFVGAYTLFMLGSILIPLSTHFDAAFGWFLFGRVLTALGGGAMVPVALAVIGDVYPEGRRARALGTLGAIETMGWVWGPLYGAMLVRLLSWQWQFWLNIPLAIVGIVAVWWALADHDRPRHGARIDWIGAILLTGTLVSLNMALLGSAEIQSVNGLQELTGDGTDLRWLYPVALVAGTLFVLQQRTSANPLIDRRLFRGRTVLLALLVNFVVGAGLVIAMVDVPLFVNSVELDLDRAAVISGLILSALTAAMAVASYVGGHLTERTWFKPPVLLGLSMASGAYAWMGATWSSDTSYPVFALQLALLGAGFGLTVAPTTNAVVDSAPPDQRGAAASVVMVVRLLGLSVGLSALTAWGLSRFNALRSTIDLPPLTDPNFESALLAAQEHLTAQAIAETFTAAAVVLGAGLLATFAMRRLRRDWRTHDGRHRDHRDGHPRRRGLRRRRHAAGTGRDRRARLVPSERPATCRRRRWRSSMPRSSSRWLHSRSAPT